MLTVTLLHTATLRKKHKKTLETEMILRVLL